MDTEAAQKTSGNPLGKEGIDEGQRVPIQSLSDLTGFPIGFIQKELLLESDEISLGDLRQLMVAYLEKTSEDLA